MKTIRNLTGFIVAITAVAVTVAYAADSLQTSAGLILSPGPNRSVKIAQPLRLFSLVGIDGTGAPAGVLPLGGMIPVLPNTSVGAWQPPLTGVIKNGFMLANGHTITAQNVIDGSKIPAGTSLPNMVAKHIKGGTSSSSGGGSNTITLATNQIPAMTRTKTTDTQSVSHTHGFTHGHTTIGVDTNHRHSDYTHTHPQTTSNAPDAAYLTHTHTGGVTATGGEHSHEIVDGNFFRNGTFWPTPAGGPSSYGYPVDAVWSGGYWNPASGPETQWMTDAPASHYHSSSFTNTGGGGTHTLNVNYGSPVATDTSDAANAHSHPVAAATATSGAITADHYHRTTATIGVASPTALNIEPAYVETVWVIRVM